MNYISHTLLVYDLYFNTLLGEITTIVCLHNSTVMKTIKSAVANGGGNCWKEMFERMGFDGDRWELQIVGVAAGAEMLSWSWG